MISKQEALFAFALAISAVVVLFTIYALFQIGSILLTPEEIVIPLKPGYAPANPCPFNNVCR